MGVYEHPDQCNMYFVCTSEGRVRDEHIDECSESSNTQHIYKFIYIKYISTNSFQAFRHTCAEGTLFSVATGECMFEVQQ